MTEAMIDMKTMALIRDTFRFFPPSSTLSLCGLLVSACAASAAPLYTLTGLGSLGGNASEAWGINDNGQVVGRAFTPDNSYYAFLYSNGQMQNLGSLGRDFGSTWSWAYS